MVAWYFFEVGEVQNGTLLLATNISNNPVYVARTSALKPGLRAFYLFVTIHNHPLIVDCKYFKKYLKNV